MEGDPITHPGSKFAGFRNDPFHRDSTPRFDPSRVGDRKAPVALENSRGPPRQRSARHYRRERWPCFRGTYVRKEMRLGFGTVGA